MLISIKLLKTKIACILIQNMLLCTFYFKFWSGRFFRLTKPKHKFCLTCIYCFETAGDNLLKTHTLPNLLRKMFKSSSCWFFIKFKVHHSGEINIQLKIWNRKTVKFKDDNLTKRLFLWNYYNVIVICKCIFSTTINYSIPHFKRTVTFIIDAVIMCMCQWDIKQRRQKTNT